MRMQNVTNIKLFSYAISIKIIKNILGYSNLYKLVSMRRQFNVLGVCKVISRPFRGIWLNRPRFNLNLLPHIFMYGSAFRRLLALDCSRIRAGAILKCANSLRRKPPKPDTICGRFSSHANVLLLFRFSNIGFSRFMKIFVEFFRSLYIKRLTMKFPLNL